MEHVESFAVIGTLYWVLLIGASLAGILTTGEITVLRNFGLVFLAAGAIKSAYQKYKRINEKN